MKEVVLDACVVVKWFRSAMSATSRRRTTPQRLRAKESCAVFAPPLLGLEFVNVAGRRWHLKAKAPRPVGELLGDLGVRVDRTGAQTVARWTAQGLTAYDSAYVAVARAAIDDALITADKRVTAVAGVLAQRLADVE